MAPGLLVPDARLRLCPLPEGQAHRTSVPGLNASNGFHELLGSA